jgi:hypothetical protein
MGKAIFNIAFAVTLRTGTTGQENTGRRLALQSRYPETHRG